MGALLEKRQRVEAAIRDNPDKSAHAIARLIGVDDDMVRRVRAGHNYTDDNRLVRVPAGRSLSDICRDGIALEDAGDSAEEVAAKLNIGVMSYRIARDLVRLADNKRLAGDEAGWLRARK